MKTIKRYTATIDTTVTNTSKYFNQMEFKGILEDDNIYDIDQKSFRDAKNVFVDWNNRLVTRPSLQEENIPEGVLADETRTYTLIEVMKVGLNTLYVTKYTNNSLDYYRVVFRSNNVNYTYVISTTTYHISTIDRYLIVFGSYGARIIDTNNITAGWQDFRNFVKIPVTKLVSGSSITHPEQSNQFTSRYKEQYLFTKDIESNLPNGSFNYDVTRSTGVESEEYEAYINDQVSEYQLCNKRLVPSYVSAKLSAGVTPDGQRIVCMASYSSFKLSFDDGKTFTEHLYPNIPAPMVYIGGCQISKDGQYFFVLATSGVYRCNISDFSWNVIRATNPIYPDRFEAIADGLLVSAVYYTNNRFSFIILNSTDAHLYMYGPGLAHNPTSDTSDPILFDITFVQDTEGQNKTLRELLWVYGNFDIGDASPKISMQGSTVLITAPYDSELNSTVIIYVQGGTSQAQNQYHTLLTVYSIYNRDNFGFDNSLVSVYSDTSSTWPDTNYTLEFATCSHFMISGVVHQTREIEGVTTDQLRLLKTTLWAGTVKNSNNEYSLQLYLNSIGTEFLRSAHSLYGLDGLLPDFNNNTYTTIRSYARSNHYPVFIAGNYLISNHNICIWQLNTNTYIGRGLDNYKIEIDNSLGYQLQVVDDKYYIMQPIIDTEASTSFFTILTNNKTLFTNVFNTDNTIVVSYTTGNDTPFTEVPNTSYSDTELYLSFNNKLSITQNIKDGQDTLFYLPVINDQLFISNINTMINISTTEVALFFNDKITICSKVSDDLTGIRYDYFNTKLSAGVRPGDSVINTLEGAYSIFPTKRGLASMNYQAFMATTDQVLTYITDDVKDMWDDFYTVSEYIKIIQWRDKLVFTNGTKIILLFDVLKHTWWKWEVPVNVSIALSDQIDLWLINNTLLVFRDGQYYYDFSDRGEFVPIDWFVQSQPLHMNAPNHYKNLKQLVFQFSSNNPDIEQKTLLAQIKLYRRKITVREPETLQFKIDNLRTFVKRFNYWKINEIQWGIGADPETSTPSKIEINAIGVKYELGEEVR